MLYSHRRLNLLERSVIEHGKILQNFIINYNIQMQSINSLYINKNKQEGEHIKKINLGEKISVSEDECSEYVGGADVNNEMVQLDDDDKASAESSDNVSASGRVTDPVELTPSETVIEILDEDDDTDIKSLKFSQVRELHLESGVLGAPSIGPQVRFDNLRIYSINYH
jgi:hypothetical protein